MGILQKILDTIKKIYYWFRSFFVWEWEITVSYNAVWGDSDDQTFIAKKIFSKKKDYLKFKTRDDEIVEIRGAEGLNYRITQL